MTQFAPPTTARQGSVIPLSVTDLRLDIEVLAERYEALAVLEAERDDRPSEVTDETAEQTPTADDLPF